MIPRTLADQIADALRSAIDEGRYLPGAQLPSEADLRRAHSASREPVRRALQVLINEGLVIAQQGRGYFVREVRPLDWWPGTFEHTDHRLDTPDAGADAWAAGVIAQGRVPRQQVDVSIVEPPTDVARRLRLDPEELVVVRRRLRYVDDVLVHAADSWYPRDVADGTLITAPGDVTVPGGLMNAVGHRQVRFEDELVAQIPSRQEAARLDIPAGTPMIVYVRTGFNAAARPVRVYIALLPGDRNRVRYTFEEKGTTA